MNINRYTRSLEQKKITLDSEQLLILNSLAKLEEQLIQQQNKVSFLKKRPKVQSLYIWGNVGRGKTFLMDLFFNLLETPRKIRLHFQRFMKNTHEQLFKLAGQHEPLEMIARQLAHQVDIICLDELYIDDIANAMLIGGVFKALYKAGVVIVTTSNLSPDDLYLDEMNRDRFLPTITQIKHHYQVICLNGKKDYRCVSKPDGQAFFFGPKEITEQKLLKSYQDMTGESALNPARLIINSREFLAKTLHKDKGIIWFDFEELCEKPRSQHDYIYIAQNFRKVFLSPIPQLDNGNYHQAHTDRARRFISLIDEMYDRSINLIASFEKELNQIYLGQKLAFLFNRTYSRLVHMQTEEYRLII